jgi:Domain of unknown function (DUF5710)
MGRIYLYVPFEEVDEVKSLGARHDDETKCWYIEADQDREEFRKWLGEDDDEDDFSIVSDQASVASAKTVCINCHSDIDVICIYCKRGSVGGDRCTDFSVSHITAVGAELEEQLAKGWPFFRPALSEELGEECFANHCPNCGTAQEEYFLHSDPDGPFFRVTTAQRGAIRFTRLEGTVRLSGSEGIEVDD